MASKPVEPRQIKLYSQIANGTEEIAAQAGTAATAGEEMSANDIAQTLPNPKFEVDIMEELLKIFSSGLVGGVLGYLIKAQIDHRLAITRIHEAARVSEFNKASSEFRGAFAPAIFKFKITADGNQIEKMLREELIPQGIAIEKFRPFVKDKEAYQKAWEDYHLSHVRIGVSSVYFLDYVMGDDQERFLLFENRINEILKFSEQI